MHAAICSSISCCLAKVLAIDETLICEMSKQVLISIDKVDTHVFKIVLWSLAKRYCVGGVAYIA